SVHAYNSELMNFWVPAGIRLEPKLWVEKFAITKDPRSKEMKRICLFPGVTAPALLRGAFLAILLATGLISETQAVGPSSEPQPESPSSQILSQILTSGAACELRVAIADQTWGKVS